jgi:hypothetical protein
MPKSSKRFIISNGGLNAQGFRMLTDGVDLEDFKKNPLMLWNHQRPDGNDKNQILPIGYWEDIELSGDELSAVPVFDDKDDFAMAIYNKVESGVIRMCSAGAEPLETSEEKSLLVAGQQRATVTKWRLKEASICDIGANPGALAVTLYDAGDKQIALSDETIEAVIPKINQTPMFNNKSKDGKKSIKLADTPEDENKENLNDDTENEELSDEDKDKVIEELRAKLADMEEKLRLSEETKEDDKVENLVSKAIRLRKISAKQKEHYVTLAKKDFKTTSELIESLPVTASVKDTVENKSTDVNEAKITQLSSKSWNELFHSGDLDFVKLNAPTVYALKFKEQFGKEPKNI